MASDSAQTPASPASPDISTVNLQIVSPSPSVPRPLLFPALPSDTTIKQLKERIRQTLPSHPSDDNQRLIHRGRAIVRETDTMLEIFGAVTLQSPDQQTIHLVIREPPEGHLPPPTTAIPRTRSLSPAVSMQNPYRMAMPAMADGTPGIPGQMRPQATSTVSDSSTRLPSPGHSHASDNSSRADASSAPSRPTGLGQQIEDLLRRQHELQEQHLGHAAGRTSAQSNPTAPGPHDPAAQTQAAAAAAHSAMHQNHLHHHLHQHQNMTQWLTQLQRESTARSISQNQRARAQFGMRGIGDMAANGAQTPQSRSRRASPAPGHTVVRETWGPNGRTYHVETVVRNSAQTPQPGMSSSDVRNMMRGADMQQATNAMTTAMQRSISSTSLHNRPFTQPGVTTPVYGHGPFAGSRPASGRATPDFAARYAGGAMPTAPTSAPAPAPARGPEVYILASPEGPRALLVNSGNSGIWPTGAGAYYTSAGTYHTPVLGMAQSGLPLSNMLNPVVDNQLRQRVTAQQPPQQPEQGPQPLVPDQQAAQAQNVGVANIGHPQNPIPPLLLHVLPHVWMLIRLAFFVFLFTSPQTSWARLAGIICLAIFIFVLSTGVLTGVVDQIWPVVGRHLENLIPRVDPQAVARQEPAPNAEPGAAAPQGQAPDPADAAARWVAERQQREGWLAGQFRRLERASLLFLASIAPGVAERHIATLEAEARAERERIEAAEAEAAAQAAAAEAAAGEGDVQDGAENNAGAENQDHRDTQPSAEQASNEGNEQQGSPGEQARHVGEPLIAI